MVIYSRKIMIHYQSQDDASYHANQHARIAISLLHIPFVFAQIMRQQILHSIQMERYEANRVM
jgi:hypothetical protein